MSYSSVREPQNFLYRSLSPSVHSCQRPLKSNLNSPLESILFIVRASRSLESAMPCLSLRKYFQGYPVGYQLQMRLAKEQVIKTTTHYNASQR